MPEFSPDWSLDDARRESLREHMAMVTDLARENERLRGVIRDGTLAARHVLRVVEGQGSDDHEALALLRRWVEAGRKTEGD